MSAVKTHSPTPITHDENDRLILKAIARSAAHDRRCLETLAELSNFSGSPASAEKAAGNNQ